MNKLHISDGPSSHFLNEHSLLGHIFSLIKKEWGEETKKDLFKIADLIFDKKSDGKYYFSGFLYEDTEKYEEVAKIINHLLEL